MTKPKNVLFICSDQHSRLASGCYGNKFVHTPNIDKLAENGILFKNAYTNSPICVPSRGSIATGLNPHVLELWDNCTPYFGQVNSWGHRMMLEGMRVVSIGKLHYRDSHDSNGFNEEIIPMHILDGKGLYFTICRNPIPTLKKFKQQIKDSGEGNSTYISYDHAITKESIDWLKNEAPKYSNKPWALFVSLVSPHPPWISPSKFYNLYSIEDMPLPIAYSETERSMHPGLEDFRKFFGVQEIFDDFTLKKVTAAYYGMISYLDYNIGKLIDTLNKTGLIENTYIIYTSDHGESMGHKGMFSKCNMYEESVGIPMILFGNDLPKGKKVNTSTQLIDIFPTILDATGVQKLDEDQEKQGESLFSILEGDTKERTILSEQHSVGAKSAVFMVRKGKWKYVYYVEDYPSQLFDLEKDPMELYDLALDSKYTDKLITLEKELRIHVDPEKVDSKAKDKQAEKIEIAGGMEAVLKKGSTGYTPAPGEKPVFMS